MTSAVLFDLDGTLLDLPVDIEPVRDEVRRLVEAATGEAMPARPLLEAIDAAAAGRPDLRAEARRLLDTAELAAAARARAMPGALEIATLLDRLGVGLGIVTDNGRVCVRPALAAAGLDRVHWHAVTRDDVDHPKPAADGIVAAARALCPDGGAIWYAGDTPRDVAAGRAARIELGPAFPLRVVAVLSGRGKEVELRGADADHVVAAVSDIAALVEAG